MKQQSKLTTEQQQQHAAEQQTQSQSGREFASAEELLRHDAAQIPVPPAIAQRLQKSTGDLPRAKPNWWRRLLGGTNP
jgi:hypothetical protein